MRGGTGVGAAGGQASLTGGGSATNAGGVVGVQGGMSTSGAGGAVGVQGGGSTTGAGGAVSVKGGDVVTASAGGVVQLRGGNGGLTSGNGGNISLEGGNATGATGNGGAVSIFGGTVATSGDGGAVSITGTAGVGTNKNGGAITATAGNSTGGVTGGSITFTAGTSASGAGGSIFLKAGGATTAGLINTLDTLSARTIIRGVATPVNAEDAVPKDYVDAATGETFSGTVTTTNTAAITTVATYTPGNNKGYNVLVRVSGRKTDGTQVGGYLLFATFRSAGAGAVTQVGSTLIVGQNEDDVDWDATISATGSTTIVQVTGTATDIINWRAVGTVIHYV
jgi:hypothetical protein